MQTLATGYRNKSSLAPGFTLIELLVVVVILAVVLAAGTSLMQFGVNERRMEREGQRLTTVLDFLCEQALLQNRAHGLAFSQSGYVAVQAPSRAVDVLNAQSGTVPRAATSPPWPEASLPDSARNRWSFPQAVTARLASRQQPLPLQKEPATVPQVICDATGQTTPFALTLSSLDLPADFVIETVQDTATLPAHASRLRPTDSAATAANSAEHWAMHWQPRESRQP